MQDVIVYILCLYYRLDIFVRLPHLIGDINTVRAEWNESVRVSVFTLADSLSFFVR